MLVAPETELQPGCRRGSRKSCRGRPRVDERAAPGRPDGAGRKPMMTAFERPVEAPPVKRDALCGNGWASAPSRPWCSRPPPPLRCDRRQNPASPTGRAHPPAPRRWRTSCRQRPAAALRGVHALRPQLPRRRPTPRLIVSPVPRADPQLDWLEVASITDGRAEVVVAEVFESTAVG